MSEKNAITIDTVEALDPTIQLSVKQDENREHAHEERMIVALMSDAVLSLSFYLTLVAFRAQAILLESTCATIDHIHITWTCLEVKLILNQSWDLSCSRAAIIVFALASFKTMFAWWAMKRGQSTFDFVVVSISFHVLLMYGLYPWPSTYAELAPLPEIERTSAILPTQTWALVAYIVTSLAALSLASRHIVQSWWYQRQGSIMLS